MKDLRRHTGTLVLLMMTCGPVCGASAQDRIKGQIGAAVTWNQFPQDSVPANQRTFLALGWTISGSRTLAGWLSLAAEVGVADELMPSEITHRSESNRVYAALAGPRVTSRTFHRGGRSPYDFRVFGHVLAGGQTSDLFAGGRAIQPGAGVDIKTPRGFSFRSEWDRTLVRGQHAISQFRWLTGIVIDVGE